MLHGNIWNHICICLHIYDQPRQHIKKQIHYFASKGPSSQSYGFSSSHVWMWEADHKESWAPKNWCFWTVVLEKTFESLLKTARRSNQSWGSQSWIFIGRTNAEAEAPILWPPDAKNWLIWKAPDTRKDWRQEEKGTTGGEMAGWHYRLDGHEFEQGSESWWWTGAHDVLKSMGLQRVGYAWATELNWTEHICKQVILTKDKLLRSFIYFRLPILKQSPRLASQPPANH